MPSTQQKGTKMKIYMGKIPCASSPGGQIDIAINPASQQSNDSEEDDTGSNVCKDSETTYSSAGRRTWDAGGGMGKDARIRKGKVGRDSTRVLRIRGVGGVNKVCPRGGQSARRNRDKRT
jgi:hypothetical protein